MSALLLDETERLCDVLFSEILFEVFFASVILWPLCDFRYDIDSKSPDLAKHVSQVASHVILK